MPGNTDEKEKCLEKLNEMQKFLPFLDFMIDKIRKKNDLPLECQLSKFQHIRSVIIEKNGKYSLESLTNIEDILQKLITKLDYKGIYPKEKKESVEAQSESLALPKGGQIKYENIPIDVPDEPASPSTTKTAIPNVFDPPSVSSKQVDSSQSTVDMIMKSMKMTVVRGSRQDDIKEDVSEFKDNKKDSIVAETARNLRNLDCSDGKSKESEDVCADQTSSRKDTDCVTNRTPLDVLASSRKKLLKSVSEKGYACRECEILPNKKTANINSSKNKDNSKPDSKGTKSVEDRGKNISDSDKFLICELSDISDDEYIVTEDVELDRKSIDRSENDKNIRKSSDVSLPNTEAGSKPGWKFCESLTCSISYPLKDVSSKQKLRERLSADIAELHKVPGKSVGGSLRSLKDLSSCSQERETVDESRQKKSHSRERRSEHRTDSYEKLSDSERDHHDLKKSSRKERRNKEHRNRDRERRRDEKHHHRIEDKKEDRTGQDPKHSSRSGRKLIHVEERKKRKKKTFEIDKLDDIELVAFVKENVSDLPHLSRLNPDELRKAARSSYVLENIDSETSEMDGEKDTSWNKSKGMRDESLDSGGGPTSPSMEVDTEAILNKRDTDDDDDEYSMRLIEEITPNPKNCLEPEQLEVQTKRSVPELQLRENSNPAENKDPRTRYAVHSFENPLESVSFSDPRVPYRVLKSLKSPPDPAVPLRFHNPHTDRSNCDPRMLWNAKLCSEKQPNRQYFQPQRYLMYDPCSNNHPRHHGVVPEHTRFQGYGNMIRHPNFNPCEPKSYGEYKQLKKQEKESANRLRLSLDDGLDTSETQNAEESNPEAKSKQVTQKENEAKVKDQLRSPATNKLNLCDNKNIQVRGPKTQNPKPGVETHRKSLDGDRNHEERTDKSSVGKLSSPEDELISPLDKLYANDPKPVTGRGYGLQNFKIPKKGRSSSVDQQKTDEKDSHNKLCASSDNRTLGSSEIYSDSHTEVSQECDEVKKDNTEKKVNGQKINLEITVSSESQQQTVELDTSNEDACEIMPVKLGSKASLTCDMEKHSVGSKNLSNSQMSPKMAMKCELNQEISGKEFGDFVTQSGKVWSSAENNDEKYVTDDKRTDNEADHLANDKNSDKTEVDNKECDVKSKGESDTGSKSTITEEITQELVEALISKSFESGEGELLLAKAKLFKELALKLNSKKLKTIQKIINSESDSSWSSSASSTESEKKKKKTKKRSSDDFGKTGKKTKREKKKAVKSKEYVDSSSESDDGFVSSGKCNDLPNMDEIQSESVSDKIENKEFFQSEGESPTKSKKSQRKTKLLEQIFNESPAQNFELSMGNQNSSEKESDQRCKMKGKGKGKTELDRLHEDIRSMFISSGVVTATGQRMCRILRESGGRMNNLDLVRESAKMVEEEKLASRRSKRLTNARSRSRSTDRRSLRDRSRSRSLLSTPDDDYSDVLNNRPVVMLERVNLERMSYAYKITDVPESFARRRGRNVARRGRCIGHGMTRSTREEEMYWNKRGRIYLTRNLRRCLRGRWKTRKREDKGKKLADIIQKLPLKMAKIRHLEMGNKEARGSRIFEKERKFQSPATNKKRKVEYVVEESSEILDYAFDRTKSAFSCLLCGLHTKGITAHYKTEHPDSEVLISRLEKSEAIKAVQESKEFNYDITALEQACSLELIKKRVKYKLTGSITFFCRMCSYGNVTNISQFYSHVSSHTGEYRYKCPIDGCDLAMTSRDNVRNHVLSKHPKQKLLTNKAVELFPLPSEHGILFGYLCSRCNFVQVLKRNMENHIQKVHGGAEDVIALKIDLSGKAPEEKEVRKKTVKEVTVRRKGKNREMSDGDSGVKRDDEDGGEFEDPGDEDYMYESDAASDSSQSNDDEDDDDFKSNANLNGDDGHQPRRTRSSLADDKAARGQKRVKETRIAPVASATPNPNHITTPAVTNLSDMKPVGQLGQMGVKPEVLDDGEDEGEIPGERTTLDVQKKWIVGPLEATVSKSEIMTYNCCVGQCRYTTHLFTAFESHVLANHESAVWTGVCESCDIPASQKEGSLPGIYKIADVLDHMENHIKPNDGECTVGKFQGVKKELHHSTDLDCSKPSEGGCEDVSSDGVPFPERPLLRVRSLIGDRLSKPKNLLEEELPRSDPQLTLSDSASESDKIFSEPLFTIKDVRSLNPETECRDFMDTALLSEPENYPPNAEVIAGKPILIRSCPSPKITIASEHHSSPSPIPIPVAQAKQGVEVGQLVKVVPPPKVSEVPPLGMNQLGFVATTSIRILSPGTFTTQAVIVPTFTTTSRMVSLSKTTDTTPNVTVTQSMKSILKPIISKAPMPPVSINPDVVIEKVEDAVSDNKKKSPRKKKPVPLYGSPPKAILPSPTENSPAAEPSPTLSKREQQYSVPFSGRNIKDAKIYKEMLTKTKLCQLFKCMAVECSFTCNNEIIFTQHIGLHEAQQRIKGKKKPLNKVKKIFNWQQCAYCCEVLVHTGSALSQHILTEHGHCLYQCAYCFYRAVSPTYVDLHQNTVHDNIIKEKKKLIYKCKPVPGAVMSKQFEKQIKPQHIRPYQCEHCGSKFLIIHHFFEHMNKQHQSVTAYTCHICKNLCFKADRLIAHYKLHSYSMYQCAYCLHGTENQKEMLYHLWNFHFSQPPVIYARILEDEASVRKRKILSDNKKKKTDNIVLNDLKLITFDNEPTDGEHNLEEVGSEAEQESEKKDAEPVPISVDLSAIVSELGIDVDDAKKGPTVAKGSKEIKSDLPTAVSLETMLPNAQFSSESDPGNDNSTLLISSTLSSVISQEKKDEKDVSVPIGQLPIEVLDKFQAGSTQKKSDGEMNESVDKIIMNLQQKNSSVTVSPVTTTAVDNKTQEEAVPTRSLHKLPPTVPVNRSIITSVYQPKKVAIVKKLDDGQVKDNAPLLFHQLCTTQRISTDRAQPQSVILAVPVIDSVKNPCNIQGKDESGAVSPSQNVVSLKRTGEDSPDTLKKVNDGSILKRLCLGSPSSPAVITISSVQESSLRISDVRSLCTEKTSPVLLQPPIIRVEDFASKGEGSSDGAMPVDIGNKNGDSPQEKEPPPSPEIIILEPEEGVKGSRNELVEVVDSEDDAEVKKEMNEEKTKKVMTDNDLEIRKQMEQLRNQMENETDCLLLDDDVTQDENGMSGELEKSEDSRSCFPTPEETNPAEPDPESTSLDSQQPSEGSSDKMVRCEGSSQDCDSRTGDSEDSKGVKTDESQPTSEKFDAEKTEKHVGEPDRKQELAGKELYFCGNGNCNFAAENDVELKDHLYICDFSRESTVLVCPHCSKHFKHSSPYVEHLKLHGEKKYSCGLCNLRSPWESSVTRHLKKKHKCSQVKTLPNDTKSGHFVIYPKNYKRGKQDGEMNVYSPGDEDKLPLQSIYQDNVNCAKCPYFTKVRSNMVRHLKIHLKSVEAEGSIVVPSTAPTNPVPCLDTKERMFDKMTNLAASSQMAQANKDKLEALSPEEEAKLPQFVPEQMRHKCCSPDCNYLTIDDNMLKHHIKALHDEINVYSCPHCRETVHLEFRFVPLDKIGQHLKYHDTRLYKCYHCTYFHHQKYVVEKHALEKHPERRFFVFTVREPKVESTPTAEEEQHHPSSTESVVKMWKCGFCDNCESAVRMTVIEHLAKVHNTKSKFKCKFCDMKSSQYAAFAAHFASKHNGLKVECMKALIQVNRPLSEGGQSVTSQETSNDHFDTTPLWQRDAPRIRHIRGILIEEEEIKTKKTKRISSDIENELKAPGNYPPDMFYCPLCTDKKKVFRSKSAECFRTHLYQELNYQQYACILCGKMFVDRKDCERHHVRAHPNRTLSVKQTKEDSEIKFWVDKVVAKQQAQILERKRRLSASDATEEGQPVKKKKVQAKTIEPATTPTESPKKKTKTNRLTRSSSSVELKTENDCGTAKRRSSEDKSEFVRQTRSGSAVQADEPLKKCPHCSYKVGNLNSLKTHIKLRHLKMGKWLCPYCGESFQLEKDATKHCRSSHPDEVPTAAPNPDEQMEELKDDFWVVEYGFGREKQGKGVSEGKKPQERCRSTVTRRESTKSGTTPATESGTKPEPTNVYSCGYCMIEVTDQSSIVQHFETHHKNIHSEPHVGVVGTIYYQCNGCAEKLVDFESLNVHAKDRHPNMTLQFEIRKVYRYDSKDCQCAKCFPQPCECVKIDRIAADKAEDGCHQCPRCPAISASYLDCIDHFNEHYPRYACSNCTLRFFTKKEIEEHQSEYKHKSPYALKIPSENMIEEYKAGVKVKRNGIWMSLKASKRSSSLDDPHETKKKSLTARKSTTQIPDRRSHADSDCCDLETTEVSRREPLHREAISPTHSEIST